ncbi:MAG: N-acetylornithine carbamoyltransferase, partial [Acidobacteria bacterium]|nr:N-acetylornithine carbamoyltransferase [Acidobacteriota bacterium]
FLSTSDHSRARLEGIVERAIANAGERSQALAGRSVALLFFNSSLRTRSSFEVGVAQLGGSTSTLEVGGGVWNLESGDGVVMDADKPEHIVDAARVLSRYFDAICVRSFPGLKSLEDDLTDPVVSALAQNSSVPVINLESCLWHPCQAMADVMTIRQRFGRTDGVKVALAWTPHVKALPAAVPNSFAVAAAQFGCELTIVAPEGYDLPDPVTARLGGVRVSHDQSLLRDQDAVYAKSWGRLDRYGEAPAAELRDWILTPEKLGDAMFMHCMPLRRNVEVTDAVLESPNNAAYDEAENRLHVQKEILKELLVR